MMHTVLTGPYKRIRLRWWHRLARGIAYALGAQ